MISDYAEQAGGGGAGGLGRWAPAGAMMAASPIGYIDRNTLALLAPTILRDTGLRGSGGVFFRPSPAWMEGELEARGDKDV